MNSVAGKLGAVTVFAASDIACGKTFFRATTSANDVLNPPPVEYCAPSASIWRAISAPDISAVPSESSLPVNDAKPFFAAGSRIAPASRMRRPSTTGRVCFSTRITFKPFESWNCSTFGKT